MGAIPKDLTVFGCCGDIGAGKTTVGKLMAPWGFQIINFADPLKEIAVTGFGWDGSKDPRGRKLLRVIGTEAGREYDPNIWVKRLAERVEKNYEMGFRRFVVCDCRFENEMSWVVKTLNGRLLHVRREDAEQAAIEEQKKNPHPSEQDWKRVMREGLMKFTEVDNNGTLPETFHNIYRVVAEAGIRLN